MRYSPLKLAQSTLHINPASPGSYFSEQIPAELLMEGDGGGENGSGCVPAEGLCEDHVLGIGARGEQGWGCRAGWDQEAAKEII